MVPLGCPWSASLSRAHTERDAALPDLCVREWTTPSAARWKPSTPPVPALSEISRSSAESTEQQAAPSRNQGTKLLRDGEAHCGLFLTPLAVPCLWSASSPPAYASRPRMSAPTPAQMFDLDWPPSTFRHAPVTSDA